MRPLTDVMHDPITPGNVTYDLCLLYLCD